MEVFPVKIVLATKVKDIDTEAKRINGPHKGQVSIVERSSVVYGVNYSETLRLIPL
jgi:hypothetical protein